jgi:hypothetical protein
MWPFDSHVARRIRNLWHVIPGRPGSGWPDHCPTCAEDIYRQLILGGPPGDGTLMLQPTQKYQSVILPRSCLVLFTLQVDNSVYDMHCVLECLLNYSSMNSPFLYSSESSIRNSNEND